MLDFFIDNIFVQFGGQVFQPTIGIPMGKNFASLLADFLVSNIFYIVYRSRQSSTSSQNDKQTKFTKEDIRTKGELYPEVKCFHNQDIIQMVDFFIDNIFVQFGGQVFQPTIGIPMGKNFASLLADLFLHPYETNSGF
jgi:hypothetical protein